MRFGKTVQTYYLTQSLQKIFLKCLTSKPSSTTQLLPLSRKTIYSFKKRWVAIFINIKEAGLWGFRWLNYFCITQFNIPRHNSGPYLLFSPHPFHKSECEYPNKLLIIFVNGRSRNIVICCLAKGFKYQILYNFKKTLFKFSHTKFLLFVIDTAVFQLKGAFKLYMIFTFR